MHLKYQGKSGLLCDNFIEIFGTFRRNFGIILESFKTIFEKLLINLNFKGKINKK